MAELNCLVPDPGRVQGCYHPLTWRRWWLRTREEETWCGAAPSACQGCRVQSWAERVAGTESAAAAAAGDNEGVLEDEGRPLHPDHSKRLCSCASVQMWRKLRGALGKVCGLWKCVVSAAAVAASPDRGGGPNLSSGAETVSCCCHDGGEENAVQTVMSFPV